MTTTTPNDVANGSEIARKPKTMSRIAHTIDVAEPRLGSFACAMIRFLPSLQLGFGRPLLPYLRPPCLLSLSYLSSGGSGHSAPLAVLARRRICPRQFTQHSN